MAEEKEDKVPTIIKVEQYLHAEYVFVRNEVTDTTEYRRQGNTKFEQVNEDTLHREIQHTGLRYPLNEIRSLMRSDFIRMYNPFQAYFEQLQVWDGTTDYIDMMAGFVEIDGKKEDKEFWHAMFKKMLVRSIAGVLDKIPNRIVIVFVGSQESGKSWFIRFLNPFKGDLYYTESPLRDDKDSLIRCSEVWFYNLEELGVLSSWDIQKLKAVISAGPIKERRPYDPRERTFPRRCTFIASTNKDFFLTDDQNTRWVCIRVKHINWEYRQKVDIHKMWAQAFQLYKTGFNYNLTDQEKKVRDDTNRDYEIAYSERDYVLKYYTRASKNEKGAEFMSVIQIRDDLQEREECKKELNQHNLGKALKEFNFVKDRRYIGTARVQGYWFMRNKSNLQYTEEPKHKTEEVVPENDNAEPKKANDEGLPKTNDDGSIDYGTLFDLKG